MDDALLSDVLEQVGQFVDVGGLGTSQNDSVWIDEVEHGSALSQKLRIARNCVSFLIGLNRVSIDQSVKHFVGADWDSGLLNDDDIILHVILVVKLDDASDADFSVTQIISFALLVPEVLGGSREGQENYRCVVESFSDVGGEAQVMVDGFLHDFFEARLVNRGFALLALFDSESVNVIHDELL